MSRPRTGARTGGLLLTILILLVAGVVVAITTGDDAAHVLRRPTALGVRTGFSPGAGIISASPMDLSRELDLMVDVGATRVRVDFDWSQVERTKGQPDWSALDRIVQAATERRLDVLALLTYTPAWARPEGTSSHTPPTDPEDFAAFADAAVRRFAPRGVQTYEIWNEPNIPQFWEPRPDLEAYTSLLTRAAAAVRRAAPDVMVLSGGLAPADDEGTGGQIDPRTFVEGLYARGAGSSFDALAVHPYSFPALPSDADTADFNTFQKLPAMRTTMVAAGQAEKKIWLTEVGAPTGAARGAVDEDRQAQIVLDAVRSAAEQDYLGPLFVYAMRDAGTDPADREDNFGLVGRDYAKKQGYGELLTLLHDRSADN